MNLIVLIAVVFLIFALLAIALLSVLLFCKKKRATCKVGFEAQSPQRMNYLASGVMNNSTTPIKKRDFIEVTIRLDNFH